MAWESIQLIILGLLAIVSLIALIFYVWTLAGLLRSRVPYVPSSKKMARIMVDVAEIKRHHNVYDLGCGDGKILFEAERKNASSYIGYELIRSVVWYARTKKLFKKSGVKIHCKDFFKEDISDADIIFCYLFPHVMDRIHAEIWPNLKKGAKIVSNTFPIRKMLPERIIYTPHGKVLIYKK